MAEINVVPYIDVTFVLLIIFMITAPLVQNGVEVDLPKANAEPVDQQDKSFLIIYIDKSGQYFVGEDEEDDVPLSLDDLLLRVAAELNIKKGTKVYIKGDGAVSYEKVVKLLAALKNENRVSIPSVGLMTEFE